MLRGWRVEDRAGGGGLSVGGEVGAAPRRWLGESTARLAAMGVALLLVVFLVLSASRAAFTATTDNSGNSVGTGTIALADDDAGSAMFEAVSNLGPNDSVSRCIHVDFTGSLDADPIVMYVAGAPTGTLAPYLDVVIEVGADNGDAFPACTGFSPTSTLFTGTLASFASTHADYGSGLSTWDPSGPSSRTFRVTVTVQDDPLAAGLVTGWGFTWEARSA